MSTPPATLTLPGIDQKNHIKLDGIQYLGHGRFSCKLDIQSNGYAYNKTFYFDNDEYFIAKLKEIISSQSDEAVMTDLQSDNTLSIRTMGEGSLLISGLIQESEPLHQSLEFAFMSHIDLIKTFASEFAEIVRTAT